MAALSTLESWQAVDLGNLQLSLDEQAGTIVENREKFIHSRKQLADSTRDFKKQDDFRNAPEDSIVKLLFPSLLKLYQKEVDELTKRAKFSENCFLTTYRMVRELPDPSVSISSLLEEVRAISEKNAALEKEVQQAMAETQKLTLQLSSSLKGVDENEIDRLVNEGIATGMSNKQQEFEEKVFEIRKEVEEEVSVLQTELELSLSDVDKHSLRVQELEKELEKVRSGDNMDNHYAKQSLLDKEALKSAQQECDMSKEELAIKEAKLSSLEQQYDDLNKQSEASIAKLMDEKEKLMNQVSTLEAEAQNLPTVEEYKQLRSQLQIMKKSLYNVDESEPAMKSADEVALKVGDEVEGDPDLDTLDSWLLENNRKLKQQLLDSKKKVQEYGAQIEILNTEQQKLEEALQDQNLLTNKLESDFALSSDGIFTVAEVKNSDGPSDKAVNSMLKAVCAQRDRFRAQVEVKEHNIEALTRQMQDFVGKQKSLEEENSNLYQRIRFLQSYKVSDRSTLLSEHLKNSGQVEDEEMGGGSRRKLGLGQGVGHDFRTLYQMDKPKFSLEYLLGSRYKVITKKLFKMYMIGMHIIFVVLCMYVNRCTHNH